MRLACRFALRYPHTMVVGSQQVLDDGVVIVVQHRGKYLFIKRGPGESLAGHWCPVSGAVEEGESQSTTVVREAMEEVGITVNPLRKVSEGLSVNGRYRLHYWLAEWVSGEVRIASDEVADFCWVDLSAARALPRHFEEDIRLIEVLEGSS